MGSKSIKNVTVIGAGLMGHGIALEFATHGLNVKLVDRNKATLDNASRRIELGIDLLIEAGSLGSNEVDAVRQQLELTSDLESACADTDLVIEAVFENLELKRELLKRAATTAPEHTIFASNSSSFMPSQLADATGAPDRSAITHYFNPPYLLPLVEIVPDPAMGEETVEALRTLYVEMKKRPVVIRKEHPGFVANRLQAALGREAASLVQNGIATVEDVDSVVRDGIGPRLALAGPFEIWEQAGWDLVQTICAELFTEIETSGEPSRLMLDAIERGDLGVKSGRGMYEWTPESAEALRLGIARALIRLQQLEMGTAPEMTESGVPAVESLTDSQSANKTVTDTKPKIAVIGAGLMGHGIALEFAAHGHDVTINDVSEDLLDAAMNRAEAGLKLLTETGKISEEQATAGVKRISATGDLKTAVKEADFVIEATTEDLALKRQLFQELDQYCEPDCILLSNTSTFLPSAIGLNARRKDRIAIAHYFNPPHLLPIVEVVRGPDTSDETIEVTVELMRSIGKRPAVVQKEVQGFIGNRLQAAMFREALNLVTREVVTAEQVDEVVRSSFGRRLSVAGTFELRELIGLDLALDISRQILPSLDNTRTVPAILAEKVRMGHLGTKSGKGFYDWTPESSEALRLRIANGLSDMATWKFD